MYRDDRLIRLFSSTISEGLSRFDSDPHSALKFPDQQNRKFRICLKSKKPVFRNLWRFDMDPNSRIRTTCLQSGSGSFLRCQQKVSFFSKVFFLTILLTQGIFTLVLKKQVTINQCCGSGMLIPDPDFYPSRIPDLGSRIQKQQQKREVKKIRCQTFLCSHKI